MLADISSVDAIYIVCGRTDMRKSIDGLCAIIQEQFSMEIDHALFLFCGRYFNTSGWNRYDLQKTDCPRFLPVAQK